jgi:hypothetical protein
MAHPIPGAGMTEFLACGQFQLAAFPVGTPTFIRRRSRERHGLSGLVRGVARSLGVSLRRCRTIHAIAEPQGDEVLHRASCATCPLYPAIGRSRRGELLST